MAMLVTTALGFAVGIIGTGLGGLMVLAIPALSGKKQSLLLGGSGGVMTAVVLGDLWPEAFKLHAASGIGGVISGVLFVLAASYLVNSGDDQGLNRFTRTGLLMGIGIAMHNFPEGLAVGTVWMVARKWQEWAGLAGLMAIHNVPEGMVVAATLRMGKVSIERVLSALVLVELPMAIGAMMGGWIGQLSFRFVAASLGFAAGAMQCLVIKEMIPMGGELSSGRITWFGFALGLAAGWILTLLM